MKILICGLPGSGKSTLAEPLSRLLNGVWINADEVRTHYDDWDFSIEGRIRQAERMSYIADGVVMAGKIAIADFIAPTEKMREIYDPNYLVWIDTIDNSGFPDTDAMFEPPSNPNYHVSKWFDDTHTQLLEIVSNWMKRNEI
jgi:adenylylsulfate kinase